MIYGIILAAGKGSRMKLKEKKQYLKLKNKPILFYSIDKFLKIKTINKIIIVINDSDYNIKVFNDLLNKYDKYISSGKICFVSGGKERYHSVYNALCFIDEYFDSSKDDKVLIHDSARPNVDIKDITKLISYLKRYKSISLAYRLSDSIKMIKKSNNDIKQVLNSIDRDSYYLISTPQAFDLRTIMSCYDRFIKSKNKQKITDDLQIVEYYSKFKSYLLDSNKLNFKITTKEDLNMLQYII